MERSIVFSPDTDDRQLDKEVSKIDDKLGEVDETIRPEVDTSGLDGVGSGISGGQGAGGGGGMGQAAGIGALASKIPKPIGGVSVGAALPVALGGAIGVGMLNEMSKASERLGASSTMLNQAWTMFWRPFGDRLDEMFVRDLARGMLGTMSEFNERSKKDGLMVGISWLGTEAEKSWANAVGSNLEGALETFGLDLDIGGDVSNFLRDVDWVKTFAQGFNPGAVATEIGTTAGEGVMSWFENSWPGWPDIGMPDIPDWSGITPGIPDWRDLAPSLPDWSDLGPFGGGDSDSSGDDSSDDNDSSSGGSPPSSGSGGGSPGAPTEDDPIGSPGPGERDRVEDEEPTSSDPSGPPPGLPPSQEQRYFAEGGIVNRPTNAVVGEAGPEAVLPLDSFLTDLQGTIRSAMSEGTNGGGGSGDLQRVESKLDDVNRNLKRLSEAMSNLSLNVDGETFGRAASNTRRNNVSDTDPLA